MPPRDYLGTPYIRVWLTLADDHPDVWGDDRLLSWWLRLLIIAQRMYPAAALVPRSLPSDIEDRLVELGVVEPVGAELYRFHGLDALREAELPHGKAGGEARARAGVRDRLGRWLPGAGDALANGAGHAVDNVSARAGESAGGDVLDASSTGAAGGPAVQRLDDTRRDETPPLRGGSGSSTTANPHPAPARTSAHAGARGPGGAGEFDAPTPRASKPAPPDPSAIRCDDYSAHRADHQWISGVGWRCLVCERKLAEADLTFTEKVERARERAEAEEHARADTPF